MALTPPTGTWLNVMIGSNYDPNDDQQSNSGQDLVGDATNAMLQAQRTGSSNADYTYFFRARYGDANVSGTSFYLAMDTTGDRIADIFIEAKVASNGTTTLYYHKIDPSKTGTGPSNTGWLNSTNDSTVQMTAAAADSLVTVTSAGTNLDGGTSGIDSWVTFGFKLTSLQSFAPAAGMTGDTGTILYAFTSTSQTANGDIAGINDRTADLTKTWSDLGLGIQTSLNTITTTSFGTPTVSVTGATVSEASPYIVFNVMLDVASPSAVSFTPSLSSGTATVGADVASSLEYFNGSAWVSASSGVSITGGQTSVLVRAAITNDTVYEGAESFTFQTGAITGSVVNASGASATGTIKDDGSSTNVFLSTNNTATPTAGTADNDKPTVSVGSVTVSEASNYAVVQVSLSNTSTTAISFTPSLVTGTATVGTDTGSSLEYFNGSSWVSAASGVTVAAGASSVLLRTSIVNDAIYEGSENFSVSTGAITGAVTNSTGANGTVTIKDDGSSSNVFLSTNNTATPTVGTADNDKPTVSVSSVTVSEASDYAVVQVSLDKVSTAAISFTPTLTSGTATVGTDTGSGLEYFNGSSWVSAASGVTVAAGASSVLLRTSIVNDAIYEGSENFSVSTGAITGAVTNSTGANGTVTIKDDGSSTNVFLWNNNSASPTAGTADNDTPTLSVGSVTVSEASPYAVVQVSLDKVSTAAISFTPTLTSGTATVGTDTGSGLEYFNGTAWVSVTGAVTIAAGASSLLLRTTIINDTNYEISEDFSIGTGAITGAVTNGSGVSGTVTIKDDGTSANVFLSTNNTATPTAGVADNDSPIPGISVSSVTVSEASDYAVVQVSLDKVSTAAISFTPTLTSGTATVGTDTGSGLEYFDGTAWTAVTGTVTIAAGSTSVLLRASIINDTTYEGPESFSINTGSIPAGLVTNSSGASGSLTIKDDGSSSNVFLSTNNTSAPTAGSADNDTPTLSVGSVTVSEASPYAVVQVSLDKVSTAAISFTPLLSSGTALIGTDTGSGLEYFNGSSWVSAAAGVTIAAGASSVLLRASIVNDTVYEGSETFSVSTGAITGTVTNTTGTSGTVTIKDDGSSGNVFAANNNTATPAAGTADNDTPTLSVGSVTVSEASPYAVVQVSLDKVSTSAISFTPSLADGTALVGTDTGSGLEYFDGTSWVAVTGAVTIAAGSSSVLLRTSITNDAIYEGSENFSIGTGAITGTVTNSAGTSGTVTIKDDGTSANVFLGGNNTATPTTGTADNDKSTISVSSVTVSEASDYAVVQVSLDKVSTAAISFTPSLSSGTATVGTDTGSGLEYFDGTHWVPVSGVVTIAAGASSVLLRTSITNDAVYEGSEVFSIGTGTITGTVTNSAGASGSVTIKDDGSSSNVFLSTNNTSAPTAGSADNDTPTLSVGSVTVSEASPYAVVQVSLDKVSTAAISFTPLLSSGTALIGTDTGSGLEYFNGSSWVSAAAGVTIAAGASSVLLRASIVNDTVYEGSETFSVSTGAITGTVTNTTGTSGTVTIKDDGSSGNVFFSNNNTATATTGTADNDKPTISVSSVTVSESQPYAQVSVSLSNTSTTDVVFTPIMSGGTTQGQATIGTDTGSVLQYFDGTNWLSAASGVTIAAGSQSVQLRVAIVQDTLYNEGVENFTVSTGAIAGAVSNTAGASGTVSIKDVTALVDPVITNVLEDSPQDPTPYDLLTAKTLQVVTVTGETGCTVTLYKLNANGNPIANGTAFTTTEVSTGTYTLDFGTNVLASGDYEVRLSKSGYTSNYSNSFTIDSTPGLYDITGQRANVKISDAVTVTNGAVGGMDQNRFPTFWNGTDWLDADGEKIRFTQDTLLTFNKAAAPTDSVLTTTVTSGSTLALHTQTGTYTYTPSATALANGGIDTFKVYASDGNKGAYLNLTFDPKDSLDRDGIPASVETNLATLAGNNGDLNNDGIQDATENAVTTLAWTTVDKFNAALNGTLTSSAPVISVVVAQSTTGSAVDSTSQLSDVKVLAPNSATTGGSKPANATWDPIQFAVEPLQSMGLQDIDPSRAGTQVRVMLDVSRSQMPASSFNAYMKYVNQAAVNMGITDLNGNAITAPGWYDFTQKVAGGDGARFITAGGLITAIELIITDNAFGDDDPTVGRIYDPGVPVNNTPTPAPAPAYYPVVPTVNSQTTNNIHPVLTGTATLATGETLTVVVNGATYNNVPVVAGKWSLNTGTAVPASGVLGIFVDGQYPVTATAKDALGNASTDVTSNELTIDLTPPPVPTVDSQSTTSLHPVLTGTATLATGDTLSVSLNGATYNNVSVVNGHWSIDTSSVQPSSGTLGGLVAGNSYPVTATAKDSLGNVSVDLTTNELNIVAPPATPVVTLPVPPTATPMYAVVLPTGDRWLSSSASDAHPLAQEYSSGKVVVDFYVSLTATSDTVALQAWRNVVTGDYVYLPANAKLPYACYVPNTEATLGFVPTAGHGAFDVHLYLNAQGQTQLMGVAEAGQQGLLTQGFTDLGAVFASLSAGAAAQPAALVGQVVTV